VKPANEYRQRIRVVMMKIMN